MTVSSSTLPPPPFLKLLAHEVRWNILVLLAHSDYCVQELARLIEQPHNLVSYHLRQLRSQHVVTERRSAADSRDMYYSLDFDTLRRLYFAAADSLHPALSHTEAQPQVASSPLSRKPARVLFLCTENSARSQMAETILRQLSHGTIEAFSAGSHPAEHVHPLAVQVMARVGIDMSQALPKHFDVFRGQHFDTIVTVCDRVREVCPVFPDDPERIHWSFPDPAQVEGSEEVQYHAFEQTSLQLATRIRLLITLLVREHRHHH